eukprot:COSAG05_NODE_21866_length_268_cov_7.236686_1_plen_20_part_01
MLASVLLSVVTLLAQLQSTP